MISTHTALLFCDSLVFGDIAPDAPVASRKRVVRLIADAHNLLSRKLLGRDCAMVKRSRSHGIFVPSMEDTHQTLQNSIHCRCRLGFYIYKVLDLFHNQGLACEDVLR